MMQLFLLFNITLCIIQCLYLQPVYAASAPLTPIHQAGYCAMRGQCDSSMFAHLPCVDNGPASTPESDTFRQQLVETCGAAYQEGPVCCEASQFDDLVNQVKRAEPIISSCPACWKNFMQFWCSFTCSPNQSTFVNITSSTDKNGKAVVDQADYWVGDRFGSHFFDSCKDIKFGSSNGYAMDFIGGGATGWQDMVKFMGKKQLLGSPFQINFPSLEATPRDGLSRYDVKGESCSGGDYRCACVDCQAACPVLPPTDGDIPECYVGLLRCWSFAMVTTYGAILVLASIWFVSRQKWMVAWIQHWWYDNNNSYDTGRGIYEPVPLSEDQQRNASDDDDVEDDYNANTTNDNRNHHEMLLDPDHTPRRYWLNTRIQRWFYSQGLFCARHPWVVISLGLVLVTVLSSGWSRFSVERNPVNLWVSPNSEALAQKTHFDENFSPFYRTTQLFLVSEQDDEPVLSSSRLEHLFALEKEIHTMVSSQHGSSLQDICFHPNGDVCIVQSITGYWQGDVANFDPTHWRQDLEACLSEPTSCLPESLQPLKPQMILGGYSSTDYMTSKALVVTFVLRNSLDAGDIEKAHDWEVSLLDKVLAGVNDRPEWDGVRISYSTESSLEIELNQSSNTDGTTVAISYLVMFLYASIALGRLTSFQPRRFMVESKFSLGVCGILIVIFSVSAAVGLFSFTGRKTTLIIAEVIPFLVLAVGVDNIFILCHEFDRRRRIVDQERQHQLGSRHDDDDDDDNFDERDLICNESIEESAAKTLGKMGPSILLSSLSETIAFGLGTLVSMPAVSSFAIVASTAVFVDFLLQVTCFVSCMVLDARRTEANRLDCIPCIRLRSQDNVEKEGWFETGWRRGFVPMVLCHKTRIITCLGFLGLFMFNLAMVPQVELGLDQRIALPSDSYLVPYFNDLDAYFNVGPPVYFVVSGANITERSRQKQICGRLPGCDERSLANILEQERKRPHVSYIGEPTSVWLDDYFLWLNPNFECCQLKKQRRGRQSSVPTTPWTQKKKLCGEFDMNCEACLPDWSISDMDTLPEGQAFLDYFNLWIGMPPSESCPLGGKAGYGDAIVVSPDNGAAIGTIETSHFRTFHTPLKNQKDFIQAYAAARRIAKDLGNSLDLDVYPYSVFYIFFEQYGQIIKMAVELLGLAMVAIFVITSALLGSLRSGTIVMVVVAMILTNVIGTMALWNISLNAVSLVNLVICVGISVEFCCHIARAFMVSTGTKDERAAKSLVDVGSSVFCGITLTKFAGIIVLAFTKSKIFEVYYFRMYLTIVIYGAIHGLILLPILLSLYGGDGMLLLSEFNEDGFVWDWPRSEQGLLIEDRDSFDQVLVTDMPPSHGR